MHPVIIDFIDVGLWGAVIIHDYNPNRDSKVRLLKFCCLMKKRDNSPPTKISMGSLGLFFGFRCDGNPRRILNQKRGNSGRKGLLEKERSLFLNFTRRFTLGSRGFNTCHRRRIHVLQFDGHRRVDKDKGVALTEGCKAIRKDQAFCAIETRNRV